MRNVAFAAEAKKLFNNILVKVFFMLLFLVMGY